MGQLKEVLRMVTRHGRRFIDRAHPDIEALFNHLLLKYFVLLGQLLHLSVGWLGREASFQDCMSFSLLFAYQVRAEPFFFIPPIHCWVQFDFREFMVF